MHASRGCGMYILLEDNHHRLQSFLLLCYTRIFNNRKSFRYYVRIFNNIIVIQHNLIDKYNILLCTDCSSNSRHPTYLS